MVSIDDIALHIDASVDDSGYVSNSSNIWLEITALVDNCMVPALPEPYDELRKPLEEEYKVFSAILDENIHQVDSLLSLLNNKKLKQPLNAEFISSMILLHEQMNAQGPWVLLYKSVNNIIMWFEKNCNAYSTMDEAYKQDVFVICMKKCHSSLTQDKWKKYPALMESYRAVIKHMLKFGKVSCDLHIVFPATLMLLDDYHTENKLQGLQCCSILLTNLNFSKSGYEEVIYDSLNKLLLCKDTATLHDLLNCILLVMPLYVKNDNCEWTKCDDILETILDSVYMETDRDRKNIYLKFLPQIISIMKNSIIRWKKKIMNVLCDGIDIYLSNGYDHEYVNNCVKCLLEWIKIGWPVWNYNCDHLTLVRLFKLLYLWSDDETVATNIDVDILKICIITILSLYTDSQKAEVFDHSEVSINELGVKFANVWNEIKDKVFEYDRTCAISDQINSLTIEN